MSAIVPGLDGTINDGAGFPFSLEFTDEYPVWGPVVRATYEKRWHVQMSPSGLLYSPLWNRHKLWHASVCLKEVLLNAQMQMHTHDLDDPAVHNPYVMARVYPGMCICLVPSKHAWFIGIHYSYERCNTLHTLLIRTLQRTHTAHTLATHTAHTLAAHTHQTHTTQRSFGSQ